MLNQPILCIDDQLVDDYQADYNLLIAAVGNKDIAVVKRLIELNPKLAYKTSDVGNIPLHVAAMYGHNDILELFIQMTDKNITAIINSGGETSLHAAIASGHEKTAKLLVTINNDLATIASVAGNTPLHMAANYQQKKLIRLLLQIDDQLVYAIDHNNNTSLHVAAQNGYEEIAKLLLQVDHKTTFISNKYGEIPLHCAARYGHKEVVKLLLQIDPDLANYKDLEGKKPIDHLNVHQCPEVAELLKDAEAICKIIQVPILSKDSTSNLINDVDNLATTTTISSDDFSISDGDGKTSASTNKFKIKHLDLLQSFLDYNFRIDIVEVSASATAPTQKKYRFSHNYYTKAQLQHIFDYIEPDNAQQQVELDKMKPGFNDITECTDGKSPPTLKYQTTISIVANLLYNTQEQLNDASKLSQQDLSLGKQQYKSSSIDQELSNFVNNDEELTNFDLKTEKYDESNTYSKKRKYSLMDNESSDLSNNEKQVTEGNPKVKRLKIENSDIKINQGEQHSALPTSTLSSLPIELKQYIQNLAKANFPSSVTLDTFLNQFTPMTQDHNKQVTVRSAGENSQDVENFD